MKEKKFDCEQVFCPSEMQFYSRISKWCGVCHKPRYKADIGVPKSKQNTTQRMICLFLAHLSRRLEWAIVIAHRPSSVRPSSVNFHIFNFFSRTAWWILMKLGRDEVLMVPYKCCCFSARSPQGRIQGGAKIGHGGSPSSRNFFFRPEGYRDKPNAKQWSRSMWEEVLLLFVPFQSQIFDAILTSIWTLSFCLILMQFLWIFMR